ncbi:hypothetical protein [Radicibacter daui]|uniref:hypothetical protein n=1 Tax=Radicibacter daui TaxID=3064829 RepID=UPI004046A6A6
MADYSYVAFLDILGYKNLLDTDIKNGNQAFKEKMITAFHVFDDVNGAHFSHQAISDSIFITCADRNLIFDLINILGKVFCSFLEQGLLIRGGVSYGEHFHNQTITYSPALTKSYMLESTLADFPRIMVDNNIHEMFPDAYERKLILKSGPNWFLNVINENNHQSIWDSAKAIFDESSEEILSSERVRAKHRWLQDYIIEACQYIGVNHLEKTPYLPVFDSYLAPHNDRAPADADHI